MYFAKKFILFSLLLKFILFSCSIQEVPKDPFQALRDAAGLSVPEDTEIHTDLSLNADWTRAGETRAGNLFADAFAWGSDSNIGLIASGNIRDDQGVEILKKGVVAGEDFVKAIPWNSAIYLIKLQGFRLKQNLEASVGKLAEIRTRKKGDDRDSDGPQHGDCYHQGISGGGRFFQISSSMKILINTKNAIQEVEGGVDDKDLHITQAGKRIVRISIDETVIYQNDSGDSKTGWLEGANSCKFKGHSFADSSACSFFTVSVANYQAEGSDGHPAFNPDLAEVNNDGSVIILSKDKGIDVEIITHYISYLNKYFLQTKPVIEDRILFVE